jgi:hypothetical protein
VRCEFVSFIVWSGFGLFSVLGFVLAGPLFCFVFVFFVSISLFLSLSFYRSFFLWISLLLSVFLSFSLSFLSFFVFLCYFLFFFLSLFPFFLSLFFSLLLSLLLSGPLVWFRYITAGVLGWVWFGSGFACSFLSPIYWFLGSMSLLWFGFYVFLLLLFRSQASMTTLQELYDVERQKTVKDVTLLKRLKMSPGPTTVGIVRTRL